MKKFLKPMLFLVAMATLTTSCKNDDNTAPVTPEPSGDQNIVELATATPDLSSLVAALQRADLVSALEADGNFTVLAPTNAAFDTFLAENDFASLEDIPVDALRQVLLNHVISGISSAYSAADLISEDAGYVENLADGPDAGTNVSTYFNTSNGVQFNGVSSVTTADVGATNGIVHIVDTVIPLPTVVTFIVADPNFSTLEDALINLTPAADFPSLLNRMVGETSAPFTVFAPLNAAFEKLDAIPPEDVLGPILSNHVITGGNVRAESINDGITSSATLAGDNLLFNVSNSGAISITDESGQTGINVVAGNLQAANGIIHALDTVMIPGPGN